MGGEGWNQRSYDHVPGQSRGVATRGDAHTSTATNVWAHFGSVFRVKSGCATIISVEPAFSAIGAV